MFKTLIERMANNDRVGFDTATAASRSNSRPACVTLSNPKGPQNLSECHASAFPFLVLRSVAAGPNFLKKASETLTKLDFNTHIINNE